jgi:hypothetical protein
MHMRIFLSWHPPVLGVSSLDGTSYDAGYCRVRGEKKVEDGSIRIDTSPIEAYNNIRQYLTIHVSHVKRR